MFLAEMMAYTEDLGRRSQHIVELGSRGCLGIGMSESERWPGRLHMAWQVSKSSGLYPVSIWKVTWMDLNVAFKCGEHRKVENSWIYSWNGGLVYKLARTEAEAHLSVCQPGEHSYFGNSSVSCWKTLSLRTKNLVEFLRNCCHVRLFL